MWNNISDYCNRFHDHDSASGFSNDMPESTRLFLEKLQLPQIHPYCLQQNRFPDEEWMGMLGEWHHQSSITLESFITILSMYAPSLAATMGLLARVAAGYVVLIGIGALLFIQSSSTCSPSNIKYRRPAGSKKISVIHFIAVWTICSSFIVTTDSMYLAECHGSCLYGLSSLIASIILSGWKFLDFFHSQHFLYGVTKRQIIIIGCLLLATAHVINIHWTFRISPWDADVLVNDIPQGLYTSKRNPLIQRIVQEWSVPDYSKPTPWILNGDARTGFPFLFNRPSSPEWTRVFLSVPDSEHERQVVALDLCFPSGGYNPEKHLYLVLHGANGGSKEEYVKDFASRQCSTFNGATVVVMIARGLMDLPLRPFSFFHAGRTSDLHEAAVVLRKAMSPDQVLAGVGYSMGAIVLNNYAIRPDCVLDAAFSISGSLECRFQQNFTRSQQLWQPMISHHVRRDQHLAKWGSHLEERWTKRHMTKFLRAANMVELDNYSHNPSDLTDFYANISVLGDVSKEDLLSINREPSKTKMTSSRIPPHARIHQLSIPLCILHALDDPISTWRNVVGKPESIMSPWSMVESGKGNLMLFLTEKGGHVGWPEGWLPWRTNWAFMSNAASSFVDAVVQARRK